MLGTLRTSAAAWAAVCVVFVRWHVFFLISDVKEAVWRAFRCVRRGLWSCTRVWHWLYDGLSSEEKSARRARVRVMALLVVSATVWFGVYASLRVGLADEQVCHACIVRARSIELQMSLPSLLQGCPPCPQPFD